MFFDRLKSLCEKRGITPYKACTEVGLNRAAVAKWKNGSVPNGETLNKLSSYFGVTTDYLLGVSDLLKCPKCGFSYNELDKQSLKDHDAYHNNCEKAIKKFGFFWDYTSRERIKAESRNRIADNGFKGEQAKSDYLNIFRALFSRSLENSSFNLSHVDLRHYISMLLSQEPWKRELSSNGAYELFVSEYGEADGIPSGSYYIVPETKKQTPATEAKSPRDEREEEFALLYKRLTPEEQKLVLAQLRGLAQSKEE